MLLYAKGVIKSIDNKSFKGSLGEQIDFKEVYFQTVDENGYSDTSKLTTKKDLENYLNSPITLKIASREIKGGHKLSIVEVMPES